MADDTAIKMLRLEDAAVLLQQGVHLAAHLH
jgi:sulfur transfer complex TusBCD TusB component (DsrH family)